MSNIFAKLKEEKKGIKNIIKLKKHIYVPLGYIIYSNKNYFFELCEFNFNNIVFFIEDKTLKKDLLVKCYNNILNLNKLNCKYEFSFVLKHNLSKKKDKLDLVLSFKKNKKKIFLELKKTTNDKCNYFIADAGGRVLKKKELKNIITQIDLLNYFDTAYIFGIKIKNNSLQNLIIKKK